MAVCRIAMSLVGVIGFAGAVSAAEPAKQEEIVIRGQRGSAVTNIQAITTYDAATIDAIGATSIGELLRVIGPAAKGPDGKDPIYLLNAQRVSGFEEIGTLPPEAIEKVEFMPPEAALKFGYPPTRRLMNFITKSKFRSIDLSANGGLATEGGGGTDGINAALTRIARGQRLTLSGEYRHTDPLLQSRRKIAPDPANPFDGIGNVVSATGEEIDPALSAAVGHPVFVAAVPSDPILRDEIAGYISGADHLRPFDLGPYRTLIAREDAAKSNLVMAMPVTKTISGSFTATAEHKASRSLQGLSSAAVFVAAGNPHSPFAKDVLLYRYLADQPPLVQRTVTTTLHGGALLRGAIAGWNWDATTTLDSNEVKGRGDRGVDIAAIDGAVAKGADPFGSIPAVRLSQRSHAQTRKGEFKGVANGVALLLPGGELRVTATAEAEQSTVETHAQGFRDADIALARTRAEAGLSLDIPIASRETGFLPFLGKLSANVSGNVRHVSDYGTLSDATYGLNWEPVKGLQLSATVKHSGTAPDITQKSAPIEQATNVPYFDFRTGQSVFVTAISGDNPGLRAEQGRVTTVALNWKPFEKRDLALTLTYGWGVTRSFSQYISEFPQTEQAFPDRFLRDTTGRLITVFLTPTNLYRSGQGVIQPQFNWSGQWGKAPTKPESKKRFLPGYFYMGGLAVIQMYNHVQLAPGLPVLDLLDGQAYDVTPHSRFAAYAWAGMGRRGNGFGLNLAYTGPAHIDGGLPQTDLRFGSKILVDGRAYFWLPPWPDRPLWLKKVKLTLEGQNLFDVHQHVRDANGATPNRYQPAYLDPLGRTLKATLRKLF